MTKARFLNVESLSKHLKQQKKQLNHQMEVGVAKGDPPPHELPEGLRLLRGAERRREGGAKSLSIWVS